MTRKITGNNALVDINDGPAFPAYVVPDQNWNGWALPAFTREVAEEVVKWINTDSGGLNAEWQKDAIVIRDPDRPDEPEIVEPDDNNRYWIGAFSWTWSIASRPINMDEIARIVREEHNVRAYVEHTGGGVATIYAGETDADGHYQACAGPGEIGWDSTPSFGDLNDFYVGPDDGGKTNPAPPMELGATTEAEVAALIVRQVTVGGVQPTDAALAQLRAAKEHFDELHRNHDSVPADRDPVHSAAVAAMEAFAELDAMLRQGKPVPVDWSPET